LNELHSPLLASVGVGHAFGTRDAAPPPGIRRPRQIHEAAVVRVTNAGAELLGEADAVLGSAPGVPVGIVTADCVPVLLSTRAGDVVAAVHGGWRGLAAGVVEAGVAALRRESPGSEILAAIGPRVGPCCYEVDAPVLDALEHRDPAALAAATTPSRSGHAWLDLGAVSEAALRRSGVEQVELLAEVCTACDTDRFYSVRAEGPETGRLLHWVRPDPSSS
jgi:hypothetical protein